MRSLPLTSDSRPGGRPRQTRSAWNKFGEWLQGCKMKPDAIAKKLGISIAAVYNARNGYYRPGWPLRFRIEKLSKGKVPAKSWDEVAIRAKAPKATAA